MPWAVAARKTSGSIAVVAIAGYLMGSDAMTTWGGGHQMTLSSIFTILILVMMMRCQKRDLCAAFTSSMLLLIIGLSVAGLDIVFLQMDESTAIVLCMLVISAWIPRPHPMEFSIFGAGICATIILFEIFSDSHGRHEMSWPTMAALAGLVVAQFIRGRDRRVLEALAVEPERRLAPHVQ